MDLQASYDSKTGRPTDESYFECGLPQYLKTSIENMLKSWDIEDSGGKAYYFDVNGVMATNSWIDGFYVGPDGARQEQGHTHNYTSSITGNRFLLDSVLL